MIAIDPVAERRHQPGLESEWTEAHRLDLQLSGPGQEEAPSEQSGPVAVSMQLMLQPNRRRAGFFCAVLEVGKLPVVISELDIPLPRAGLEVRSSGLWAEFVCEQPLDHWSYGLEAFALAIEDPNELLGRAIGDRVPIGWELEFEAGDGAQPLGEGAGYEQSGIGHGVLLSATGEQEIEGTALRSHWWGASVPEASPVGNQLTPWDNCQVVLPGFLDQWLVSCGPDGLRVSALGATGTDGQR